MQQAVCPRCGSSAEVRTVRELFDLLNSAQDDAMQRAYQARQQGPGYPDYPDYPSGRNRRTYDGNPYDDPGQEIANAVLSTAFRFVGKAIGRRVQRAYEERVVPAFEAKAAEAQQQWQQSRAEQATIVERYPDLRGCMRDQVVFLEGGSRVVPIAEIHMPVTLTQADALVDRLRAP